MAEQKTVRATLTRIVWQNDTRIIGRAQPAKGREISVIGTLAEPTIGQAYEFSGTFSKNEKYNSWDLRFTTYQTILPEDSAGVIQYLARTAKWVGSETAKKLVDQYGENTLQTLKNDPDRVIVDQIKGLTAERVREMSETLRANEKLEAAMIEVNNMIGGVLGERATEKAIKKWGAAAGALIKSNPYRLIQLDGISFVKADIIAIKLGMKQDARRRHAHAAMFVLQDQASKAGHTLVSPLRFDAELTRLVGTPHPQAVTLCTRAGKIIQDTNLADADLYDAEQYIANTFIGLANQDCDQLEVNDYVGQLIETLEEDQLFAFQKARDSGLLFITGAPGTGKTYTVARIVALWRACGLNISLAAPTGKAAKQMERALSEICHFSASTIHSLLEAGVEDGEFLFARNEDNVLDCNALVIDETSMVDVRLMRSLLRAVPNECRVLFVGDNYQLPSVGPGAVLRDSLNAKLPSVELTKIKRNAGLIVRSCHAIKDGKTPTPAGKLDLDAGDNWRHIPSNEVEHTCAVVEALLRDKLPALGLDPIWQAQIISPTNEAGPLSCKVLNRVAKGVVNPAHYKDKLPFTVDDKIVRCKNGKAKLAGGAPCSICSGSGRASKGRCIACMGTGKIERTGEVRIVNGDIGVVREITAKTILVDFIFPDRRVVLPRMGHELKQAFCMTCHKMQGSEVDVVILPIHKGISTLPMVTREWLYTAVSRAKKFIITIGGVEHLPKAIGRVGNTARVTSLERMILSCQT